MTTHCGFVNLVKQGGLGQTQRLPGLLFALGGGPLGQLQRSPRTQLTFKGKDSFGGADTRFGDHTGLAESILGEVLANLQLTQAVSSPTKSFIIICAEHHFGINTIML